MANLRDIKRRITSVKSTQKITKAMKMVAAANLRRAQEAIVQARPYAFHMRDLVQRISQCSDTDMHPLLRPGAGKKIGLVVITSDRGLCGGFNANIVNTAMKTLRADFADKDVEFTVVGRKGIEMLKRRDCKLGETFTDHFDGSVMRSAADIIDSLADDFKKGETDEVYCIYNEFKSAVQQKVVLERLLPVSLEDAPTEYVLDFIYEPDQEVVFDELLMKNMNVQMYRILRESAASEFGARMTAMESATNNAGDMIDRLTMDYNRARQSAITTQLIEVISGAEAL